MNIYSVLLLVVAAGGILLASCNYPEQKTVVMLEPSSTIQSTEINPPQDTVTPGATASSTTEPVSITISLMATATISPAWVEIEPVTGSTRIADVDQMVQVYVPAGEFTMGSDAPEAKRTIEGGRAYPEVPVHTVYLEGYWIDKYEVTNAQYALCVGAGLCQPPFNFASETRYHYYDDPAYANYPVIWINWYMARAYCEWTGRRLPTEAEWEKAARGTDGRIYPWGNEPLSGERANFCDINCERDIANINFNDGYADTAPVGSYPAGASPYGAMDMAGNVWEWLGTLIMPYPYDPDDGRENLDVNGERCWRGGPWSNGFWWMRSSVRYRSVPTYWWVNLGFRCASTE